MDKDERHVMLPFNSETGELVIGFINVSMVREDQIMQFKEMADTGEFIYMPFRVTDHTADDMGEYI